MNKEKVKLSRIQITEMLKEMDKKGVNYVKFPIIWDSEDKVYKTII